MEIVNDLQQLRQVVNNAKSDGKIIGFVPTMGALHAGHISLVETARAKCGFVVVSIFVNPTQFGPAEDLEAYPKCLDQDAQRCQAAGVDVIFAPSAEQMY